MSDEDKAAREKRKAFVYDVVVLMLATALFMQVAIPAMIPLVQSFKGTDAPKVAQVATKAPTK